MLDSILLWLVPISLLMLIVYFGTRTRYRNIEWDNYAVFMLTPTFVTAILIVVACIFAGSGDVDVKAERKVALNVAASIGYEAPDKSVREMAEAMKDDHYSCLRKEKESSSGLTLSTYLDGKGAHRLDVLASDGHTLLLCGCTEKEGAAK